MLGGTIESLKLFELIAGSLIITDVNGICLQTITCENWPDFLPILQSGDSLPEHVCPTDQSRFKNKLAQVMETGVSADYKYRYEKSGQSYYLLLSVFRQDATSILVQLKDCTSAEESYRATLQDVGPEKEKSDNGYEEQLWQWNKVLSTIMEHAPFFIFVKDVKDGLRYIYNNIGLKALQGDFLYTGKNDYDLLPFDQAYRYHQEDKLVIESKKSQRFQHTHRVAGKEQITETLKIYVEEPNRSPIIIGIVRDITDQEKNRKEMIQNIDRTKESESIKTRFLANISQEIRSPLNTIVGFSELLAVAEEEDLRLYYKNLIEESSKKLTLVIDELLDLTRIKGGDIDLIYSEVSPYVLCEELLNMFQSQKHKQTELLLEKFDSDLIIESDGVRLYQAMSYVLNAACRLTFAGKICFGYSLNNPWFEFYVHGLAIDINSEISHSLFSLDVQSDQIQAGIILELSLCKMIVESMGGNVSLEAKPEGSQVSLRIPCRN